MNPSLHHLTEGTDQTEMNTMARAYRNTPDTKQTIKRRKSKKNKATWKALREQQHHAMAMETSQHLNIVKVEGHF